MYIPRSITSRLKKLLKSFPVVVVVGARQVGKSTLLQNEFGDRFDYVVFDPVLDLENARQDPELFLDNHQAPLILDEIQYVPELIPAIKRRVDKTKKPGQYLITGSQQWEVLKNISESLAGRAVILNLYPFSISEINKQKYWLKNWLKNSKQCIKKLKATKNAQTLHEQLWRGFFPKAQEFPLDQIPDFYQSYLRTYVERDVRMMAAIDDLQSFSRFTRLLAALSAQEVNYSQLGRDISVTPQTSKRWIEILKAGFQWLEIPPFYGNVIKRLSKKPKGYLTDTGFICNAQAISSPSAVGVNPLFGALFETAVVMDLVKQNSTMPTPAHFYHWRAHSGAEVDLILEKDGIFFPIEIKSTTQPSRQDLRGIRSFREAYPKLNIGPGLVICATNKAFALSKQDYAIGWDMSLI